MNPGPVQVNPWLYWALFPAHQLLIRSYFGPIHLSGQAHLPPQGPVVLACKHLSRWDPLVLYFAIQKPLYFMTDAQQFGHGPQGWIMRNMGAFPVNRNRPEASSVKTTLALLQQSQRLVIFPEGGIARDQPLRPLKLGLARIVLQAEAIAQCSIPIVPIALRYAPDAIHRAQIWIDIAAPIRSDNINITGEKAIAQAITDRLEACLRGMMLDDRPAEP